MTHDAWTWRGKDGSHGRLLYESGNWGDLLKLLWAKAFIDWAGERFGRSGVDYLDPFAGAPAYPLGERTAFRFTQARLKSLDYLVEPFLSKDLWPSTASAVYTLVGGDIRVFDADPDRLDQWRSVPEVTVATAESGWDLLGKSAPKPEALWLVDPYDVVAEWRDNLSFLTERAGAVSILLYIYNRSAKNPEAFREYRAFRNALDDRVRDLPKRLGRVAADAFLPQAHHEMLLLPSRRAAADPAFPSLLERLEEETYRVNAAQHRAGMFDA